MPLLVITGTPTSGKSTIAKRIYEYFDKRGFNNLTIVSDECNGNFSPSLYETPRNEREQHDYLRSKVQRQLSKTCLVICDSLNYVKGFRYELYCIAKLVNTTYAVVFCNADIQTSLWLNLKKNLTDRYSEDVIKSLKARYEPPEAKNRWDSPLFEINVGMKEPSKNSSDTTMIEECKHLSPRFVPLPLDSVYSCLVEGKELPANLSTLNTPIITYDFAQTLEQVTKEVISSIFQQQNGAIVGDVFTVPYCLVEDEKVLFKRQRSLPELSRLRRQFISYAKKHPVEEKSRIASLFVNFLNSNM